MKCQTNPNDFGNEIGGSEEEQLFLVYKTLSEPQYLHLSFFKVLSGKIKILGDELTNESIGQI